MACARARTYTEHAAPKNFVLEHTKPLFNENGSLSLRDLYKYFTGGEVGIILQVDRKVRVFFGFNLEQLIKITVRGFANPERNALTE